MTEEQVRIGVVYLDLLMQAMGVCYLVLSSLPATLPSGWWEQE